MSGSEKFIEDRQSTELRESEAHYRAVAEAAPDAIITIDSESTILLVNPAAETIFGYTAEEMLGRSLTMLMPRYQRHLHREGIGRYLETGRRHMEWAGVQLPGLHKNGEEIALEISFLEFAKSGRRFFTGIVRNVTERKHAQEALQETAELLSAIIKQTTVGISVVDTEGRFTFANERYCQIVGRTREELLKASMADITHPDDLPGNLAMLKRATDRGGSFEIEKRYVRPGGADIWVHNIVSVLHDEDGKPRGVMAVTLDITERKRAEGTERILAAIVESTDDAVLSLTLEGIITSWNKGAERMYGYRADGVVGRHVSVIIPDIIDLVRLGESQRLETVRVRKDGTPIDVAMTISVIKDSNGRTVGASVIARDITERKRSEN